MHWEVKVCTDHPRDEAHSISWQMGDPLPMKRLCSHPTPSPQPLPPVSSKPNALKSLEGGASLTRKNWNQLSLQCFSVLKGLGALESFSHSSTAVCHWATNSTGMVSSKLWKASIWSLHIGTPSWIFFINVQPYQTYRVSGWVGVWRQMNTLPNLIIFFQFQSPKWSSSVLCREPGLISFVLCMAGLILAQPCSGASLSVLPMPFVRLKENCKLHASTCAGRWNFGMRKRTDLTLLDRASSGGKIFICSQRFLCHWHGIL